jgi:hypothetical protein
MKTKPAPGYNPQTLELLKPGDLQAIFPTL